MIPGAKGIQAMAHHIPSWISFRDTEKMEWLNKILAKAWPYYDAAICEEVKAQVRNESPTHTLSKLLQSSKTMAFLPWLPCKPVCVPALVMRRASAAAAPFPAALLPCRLSLLRASLSPGPPHSLTPPRLLLALSLG